MSRFKGTINVDIGTVHRVVIDVSGEPYVDLEREAEMLLRHE